MNNTEDIINDYIRCTKAFLIIKDGLSGFYLWRPFIQESGGGPFEILHHRSRNDAINYFLSLLRYDGSIISDTSRSQYDRIYRFNRLVEKTKYSFTDAYICHTLDNLKIVNTSDVTNKALYTVLFPRERILWTERDVERMRSYVETHYKVLSLGQRMFEEDFFIKERGRIIQSASGICPTSIYIGSETTFSVPTIRLDLNTASISLLNGNKEEFMDLQPLPKAWLIYFILHKRPLLYSDIKADYDSLSKYYRICNALSKTKRGRPRKDNSSLKPGAIIRKINAELARCSEAVAVIPGLIAIIKMEQIPLRAKQIDVPKQLLGAEFEIIFPENKRYKL